LKAAPKRKAVNHAEEELLRLNDQVSGRDSAISIMTTKQI
jgi:hypothetical protein